MHAKRSHKHIQDPVVHVRVRQIKETTKEPSMHQNVGLQSIKVGLHMEEKLIVKGRATKWTGGCVSQALTML